jgi:predicted nucleotidyltransferase component of viral defense system
MSKEKPTNISASVRQRLLNLARKRKDELQLVLIRYGVERLLYRLSVSPYSAQFVLKGAMLFQLWTQRPYRSTLDVDLLGSGDADVDRLVKIFREVCIQDVQDDGLTFEPDRLTGGVIREDQRYGGVRLQLMAMLGNARIPIQVDIGFGDAITPKAKQVEYPTMLGQPAPVLSVYPKETVVAEKYEAMASLGIANSRMKDYYDLWVLAREFEFEGLMLARAVRATFERRKTPLPAITPVALTREFARDTSKQTQWAAFVRRGRLVTETPELESIIALLHSFLWPVNEAVVADRIFEMRWNAAGPWRSAER